MLQQKHLLGLEGYPAEDIQTIIDTAFTFREVLDRPIKKVPSLQGKTIVNLFFENSTRTRISFELAQKRLSADTVNFSASTSSLKKGETFKDTAQNIEAMKIDAVVQSIIGFVGKDQRPMISTRSTNTSVRVKNGETLLIGGLIFDTEQEIASKVPLLGDIPLIKWMFRSGDNNREQRELLIFITPTVISNDT